MRAISACSPVLAGDATDDKEGEEETATGRCGRGSGGARFASPCARPASAVPTAVPSARFTGRRSYARRLMFSKFIGEILSVVMLPPGVPQPSDMEGKSFVVY